MGQWLQRGGYPHVGLAKGGIVTSHAVHILVLTAFTGPCPEGHEACHGPEGKTVAALTNLSWGTRSKNTGEDRLRDGQDNRGEKHGNHTLTVERVRAIRAGRAAGRSLNELAVIHGVCFQTISDVCRRKSWAWLDPE